jgi:hypothetical protein
MIRPNPTTPDMTVRDLPAWMRWWSTTTATTAS